MVNAFANEWLKLGGGTVLQQRFGSASELKSSVNSGISLSGTPVSTLPSASDSSLGNPEDVPVSSSGGVDAAWILATPEQIAYIKPMIALRNGSQSNVTLYASSRSAQGTAGPDFRLEMEGLQYSEIPMLAGSNPALMQQALSAVRNDYSLARLYAMGADAWSLANHFAQMRQTPGFELNGNTGDLTATQDCARERGGEIDLIMRDGAVTVFVEVRYRRSASYGDAASSVTQKKQQRLLQAARLWLSRQNGSFDTVDCRFDVVAFTGNDIQWLRNAFGE